MLKEFLVALGLQDNMTAKLNQSLRAADSRVSKFASGFAKQFLVAGAAVAAFSGAAVLGLAKFADGLAKSDEELEAFARGMGMAKEEAYKTKSALDVMGKSLDEVRVSPLLFEQFERLKENASTLELPDMSDGLKTVRDMGTAMLALKQTAANAMQWVGFNFLKYVKQPMEDARKLLGGYNEAVKKAIPEWSDKIGKALSWIVQLGVAAIRGAAEVFKAVGRVFDMIPGKVKMVMGAFALLGAFLKAGPIGQIAMAISAVLLLLDDFYTYLDGGESLLGPVWKFLAGFFGGFADSGKDALSFFVDDFLPTLSKNVSEAFPKLVESAMSYVGPFLDWAAGVLDGVVSTVAKALPQILDIAADIASSLLDGLLKELPAIIGGVARIAKSIIGGISSAAPKLMDAASGLLKQLLDVIVKNLPDIVKAGVELLLALVDGLLDALPQLLEAAIGLISSLLDAIVGKLPEIVEMGITLLISLVEGLVAAIPKLIHAAVELIPKVVQALVDNLPKIIEAGIGLIIALVSGLIQAIPKIIAALPQIVGAILEGLGAAVTGVFDLGSKLVESLWDGIKSMAGWIGDKVSGFIDGLFGGGEDKGATPEKAGKATTEARGARGHAEGGVFDKEHYARFAEGGNAEAVVPLTKPKRAAEVLMDAASYIGGSAAGERGAEPATAAVETLTKAVNKLSSLLEGVAGGMGRGGADVGDVGSRLSAFLDSANAAMANMARMSQSGAAYSSVSNSSVSHSTTTIDARSSYTINDASGSPRATADLVSRTQALHNRNLKGVFA